MFTVFTCKGARKVITLTIDGKKVQAEEGKTILEVATSAGIEIPTLCYHKALPPYGACRMCIVEIHEKGKSKIEASCTYPAQEGLVVLTCSEKVIKARKVVIELLLARCPDSEQIQNLAKKLEVSDTRFKKKNEDCTLCGLCVRMCAERMGSAAIGFMNRGFKREVGTPFGELSDVCQTCGACDFTCPTGKIKLEKVSKNKPMPILAEFDENLRSRPPIHILYPQAVPRVASIDKDHCVHYLKDKCGICEVICEAEAINYEQKEEIKNLQVGAIILTPGYEKFDAKIKGEYGYGRFKNVVTSLQFERILSASGPFQGHLTRLSDQTQPKKIAFIQCVGSRDPAHANEYCSSVCCTYAVKEAIIAKEHAKDGLDTTIFYMDMRTFGKGFDAYFERAKKDYGVKFVDSRVAEIQEDQKTSNLKLKYETESGDLKEEEYDMVVLSVGLCPPAEAKALSEKLGFSLDEYGFCKTEEFTPLQTTNPGIFAAGVFQSPKDIPETVMQSSGAAAEAGKLISEARGTLITKKVYPPETDVVGQPPRIGVFVCHCGINIAGVVNVPEVTEYAKTLSDVVYVENNLYTCSQDTQKKIKEMIKEHNLNRVVVASCTPRTHEPLFRDTVREAGLNPYLFEMANIRDQCSWVHMQWTKQATEKAKDLVRIAIAKSRLLEPLYSKILKINKEALIIGGGLSGMTAALNLAEQRFEVHLIEKEKDLGGNLKKIRYSLEGKDPQEKLLETIKEIKEHSNIHLYTEAKVSNIEGSLGNFKTTVEQDGKTTEIQHGAIIVATGAQEYKPTEYLYGKDTRILTQLELEDRLAEEKFNTKCVVMIQCVGSRCEERPYCSRVCCLQAINNALIIKERNKDAQVFILYRDIRTYGLMEKYYSKARQKGIIFVQYEEDKKPEVYGHLGKLKVKVIDPILESDLVISPDLLVLSAGIVPNQDNKEIAQMLKVPLDQNGFFLEAHMKLRPVDFANDGVFLCGLAHSPKLATESIGQASGAAARAVTVISKDTIDLEATTSFVVDENCDGCAYCIDPCPYKAVTLIEYKYDDAIKKTVEVNESLCKGCGVCMATCPKKGIYVKNFKLEQLSAMVEAFLQPA